jgi:hypothetical protein
VADDTRRPQDDDETPTDPPTGEGEVVGADWLASQIDAAPTGQFDTRQAPRDAVDGDTSAGAGRAGDSPVLAWWREKLIAADALVNPESRQAADTEDAADTESAKDAKNAESDREAEDDGAEPLLPEPATFEPRRAEKTEPGFPHEPEPAFLPEPAFAPEPAWTPVPSDGDSTSSFDRQPEAELEDEAETGLIPSVASPLFTPRSAREHIVEESEEQDLPADEADPLAATTAFPVLSRPDSEADAADRESEVEPASEDDSPDDTRYETEDLDNFSWKLTANDQLDPRVHRSGTGGNAATADEASSPDTSVQAPVDSEDGLPTRRQVRAEDEQEIARPEPAAVAAAIPMVSGPRRRTFTGMESPSVPPPSTEPASRPLRAARPAAARAPRPVILAAIGVVALLVLGGLFFLGSQLPGLLAGPAPAASPSPAATPTPTTPPAPAAPVGPAAPGEQEWTALGGGECIDPYASPWAETFTVVDCAEPHAAQMVFAGSVAEDPAAEYPGEDEILERIYLWCSAPGVLDPAAAGEYSDLQVQGTYPVSEEQWADGQRNYYCFVNRSSGEPLSGSVAAPQG